MKASRKRRILCIDRDTVSLNIRTALLNAGRFEVTGESSVAAGRNRMQQQRFDAVVVDENVCSNRREEMARISEIFSSIPVLLLQSRSPFAPRRVTGNGPWTFAKGEGPEAFLAAVQQMLQIEEPEPDAGASADA